MSERDWLEELLERLVDRVNSRDLDGLVDCFADDYVNETPVHPHRGFRGNAQVRRNWEQIFATVPDVRVQVPRKAVRGDTVWTEWEMSGTRTDGGRFHMRGVVIFQLAGSVISGARFYLEPVEHISGDIQAAMSRVLGKSAASDRKEPS